MCQAFDELLEDKKQEGIKEGERKGRLSIIRHLLAAGMEESQILKITQCSEDEITECSIPAGFVGFVKLNV